MPGTAKVNGNFFSELSVTFDIINNVEAQTNSKPGLLYTSLIDY